MLDTTKYKKNIFPLKNYKFKLLKPSTNIKLGKKVIKGMFKDYKIFTLTLIERETCPKDCYHYDTCYGNNMPFAHRIDHKDQNLLEKRLIQDLTNLNGKKVLIRLHVLGDFFNVRYVRFWRNMLFIFPNIAVYGYTGNNENSKYELSRNIAKELKNLNSIFNARFRIRFSNDTKEVFSANSLDIQKPKKGKAILCPVQENKVSDCGACGLCWNTTQKQIIFKTH